MRRLLLSLLFAQILLAGPAAAESRIVCTLIEEVTAPGAEAPRTLVSDGDCDTRYSPASTFKIAIALMGFDAGILTSPSEPEMPFRKGYVDWREAWKQPTDPTRWMQESVVWYSQQVTSRLGLERFRSYVDGFDYGNQDLSGERGEDNGLTDAWLSASLKISPAEQVAFLQRMLAGELPVSQAAVENTAAITDYGVRPGGWHVHGKTGSGLPRDDKGSLMWGEPFGWFVGWAERDGRRVVFARLVQETEKPEKPAGPKTRDGLFAAYFDRAEAMPK
ncbi:class D beta-lactamase [Thalassobaculum sp. OXR-137]|uniref:class D beta-lactamase n=1 Tax=Thalassobaculum sp. OXR-137 TaxID=3100173 RepID=UPI002AC99B6E|nr:class D beta-lactamase [Thalassobaculum sp. OXR-137]WPZ36483.1 class D beta-lactamase [Thalassobaculum sp. OXR-137]